MWPADVPTARTRAPSAKFSPTSPHPTIVEVNGGIRDSAYAAAHYLMDGYRADEMCERRPGAPLIPCPNRLTDAANTFDGTDPSGHAHRAEQAHRHPRVPAPAKPGGA